MTPEKPASAPPIAKTATNSRRTLTPVTDSIARSSTPARIIMPSRVLLSVSQSPTPIDDGGGQHDQPIERIAHRHDLAARFDRGDDRRRDGAVEPFGNRELIGLAAPDREHQIGGDDGNADRDQGLAQFVAGEALKHEYLQQRADQREHERAGDDAEEPIVGPLRDVVADIGAEQIERAMREIDVAHQAEDQGEAAGDQEIEARQRDAVEHRADEGLLADQQPFQPSRPDAEHHPEEDRAGKQARAPSSPGARSTPAT